MNIFLQAYQIYLVFGVQVQPFFSFLRCLVEEKINIKICLVLSKPLLILRIGPEAAS
jgi:hypothetical protein